MKLRDVLRDHSHNPGWRCWCLRPGWCGGDDERQVDSEPVSQVEQTAFAGGCLQCLQGARKIRGGRISPKSFPEPHGVNVYPQSICRVRSLCASVFLLMSSRILPHEWPRRSWADIKNDHCLVYGSGFQSVILSKWQSRHRGRSLKPTFSGLATCVLAEITHSDVC